MQAPAPLAHRLRQAALAAAALALAGAALANDRPFESARTAVAEDDAQTWSFESWTRRIGGLRSLSVESEYVFGDGKSLQFELARSLDRLGGERSDTGHEAEVEYKHLFNDIARDGWGLGASAALGVERLHGSGRSMRTVTLRLPLSLDIGQFLAEPRRGPLLHLNAAVTQTQGSRRVWAPALALEQALPGRNLLFAELAREGADKLGQIGLRHWLRREKLALDIAWQQRRSGDERSSGWVAGIGWYDL
jgi:hypothetical protein